MGWHTLTEDAWPSPHIASYRHLPDYLVALSVFVACCAYISHLCIDVKVAEHWSQMHLVGISITFHLTRYVQSWLWVPFWKPVHRRSYCAQHCEYTFSLPLGRNQVASFLDRTVKLQLGFQQGTSASRPEVTALPLLPSVGLHLLWDWRQFTTR